MSDAPFAHDPSYSVDRLTALKKEYASAAKEPSTLRLRSRRQSAPRLRREASSGSAGATDARRDKGCAYRKPYPS